MSIKDIVGRISGQSTVGYKADDNGMVKGIGCVTPGSTVETGPVVDLSTNQQRIRDIQFQYFAEKLAGVEEAQRVAKLAEGIAYAQGLRVNELQDRMERLEGMVEDLAKENAELRGQVDILAGKTASLELSAGFTEDRATFDRMHPTDSDLTY